MILCDTNILIELHKGNPHISSELHYLGDSRIAVSAVTAAELMQGALNRLELQQLKVHLQLVVLLPITEAVSQLMLQLMETYCLSHRIQFPDALIAATALHHGLPLYTLNRKDFRYLPDLQLHEPA